MLFGQAAAPPAPVSPLQPARTSPSLGLPAPPPRRSPRLIKTVNSDGRIIATPAKPPSPTAPAGHTHLSQFAPPPFSPLLPVVPSRVAPAPRVAMRVPRVDLRRSARIGAQSPHPPDFLPQEDKANEIPAGPAYNTRSRKSNLRSVTQETMLACAEVSHLNLSPKSLASRRFPLEMLNAVLDEDTGELMEYRALMKNPKYSKLYGQSYAKELGRLAQGIPGK